MPGWTTLLMVAAIIGSEPDPPIPIQVDQILQAELPDGNPHEATASFELITDAGGPLTIEVESLEFDTYLRVLRADDDSEMPLARADDNSGLGTNSRIVLETEAGRRYRIEVQSEDSPYCGRGFEISVRTGRPDHPFDLVGEWDADGLPFRMERQGRHMSAASKRAEEKGTIECRIRSLLWQSWFDYRSGGGGLNRDQIAKISASIESAVDMAEDELGSNHPAAIDAVRTLASFSFFQPEESKSLYERTLAASEKAHGPVSIPVAEVLLSLAKLTQRLGQRDEAMELNERHLQIYEEILGTEDPRYRDSMLWHHFIRSQPREAIERGLEILESAYGPDHPTYAHLLGSTGGFLATGRLDAIERQRQAVLILQRAYGPEDMRGQSEHFRLAIMLWFAGDYAGALALQREVLEAEKLHLPQDATEIRGSWKQIGELLLDMGDEEGARQAIAKAAAIPGDDTGQQLRHVDDMRALLHIMDGNYDKARPLVEGTLKNRESVWGTDSGFLLWSLDLIARVQEETGDHDGARATLERCLAICKNAYNPACFPMVHERLGTLALVSDDPEAAKTNLARAHELEQSRRGSGPALARYSLSLARAQAVSGEASEAFGSALLAERLGREHLRLMAAGTSERLALRYAAIRSSGADLALSLLRRNEADLAQGSALALDAVIRARAAVMDETAARRHAIHASGDPEIARLAEELVKLRTQLANVAMRGPLMMSLADYNTLVDSLVEAKEKAETELASKSAAFRREREQSDTGRQAVAASLSSDAALVSFVRYSDSASGSPSESGMPSYLAFILRPHVELPVLVSLGEADPIDRLVRQWREAVIRQGSTEEAGGLLRAAVWDPVTRHLEGVRKVFIVPDGVLNFVNFAALPASDGTYIIEKGPLIHYLSAERDLVAPQDTQPSGDGLLAVGGVAFDATRPITVASASGFRGWRAGCSRFATHRFAPLPGSATEVEDVTSLWPQPATAHKLTGIEAGETIFKRQARGKRVLHLATHGFFLGGECPSALHEAQRGLGGVTHVEAKLPTPIPGEQPLLLSGLALAGANNRDEAGADEDDGILTAEEIASLDLSGVEWAVLSACDTGAGTVQAGEGVLGLRRAFQVAGARTVIMSLWPVEDESTRQWMKALYEGRLKGNLDTAEAVRQAGLEMLDSLRKRGEDPHPLYWGAFVAAGDWR